MKVLIKSHAQYPTYLRTLHVSREKEEEEEKKMKRKKPLLFFLNTSFLTKIHTYINK
jgi:hypothetical protein